MTSDLVLKTIHKGGFMKKTIFAGALLLLTGLVANGSELVTTTFSYSSSRDFYACSYAERQMKNYIEVMGGEVQSMRCSGGLPYDRFLTVKATFATPVLTGVMVDIHFAGKESCDFNARLINQLMPYFDPVDVVARNTCFHSQGRYSYSFSIPN